MVFLGPRTTAEHGIVYTASPEGWLDWTSRYLSNTVPSLLYAPTRVLTLQSEMAVEIERDSRVY